MAKKTDPVSSSGEGSRQRKAIARRSVLGGLAAGLIGSSSTHALAQTSNANWFDQIFGNTGSTRADDKPARKQEVLNDLRPDTTPWRSEAMLEALEGAIQKYEKLASAGGWPLIPGQRQILQQDDDERIPALRRRLQASGDLPKQSNVGGWGDDLETAVRRFQENHGMRISGRVDRPTLQALNVPVQARIAQLRLNHTRLRELQQTRPEDRYILVNAAAFQLEAVERGEVQLRHRVIAGKPERQTPVVRAMIKGINVFPYWRVPDSVATLDLIPRLQKDPEYLTREKIRVVKDNFNGPALDAANIDWRTADAKVIKFRQDPGPQNALGLVRIDMPNSEGVYMHDTPMKPLFQQRGRAFSAGCVRVQDVFKLAEWIARYESGWDQPGRIEQVIEGNQALDLNLTRQVPVYFTYITAWAEPSNGRVQFRPDVYGRDGLRDLTAGRDRDESEGPAPTQALAP
jgi:L,D-transpeptidase YcbB